MNLKNLNEELKRILNELAWKNACGQELTKEKVEELRIKHPQLPELKSESIDAKISWLITYVDKVKLDELEGLKISNIGEVYYIENNEQKVQSIILAIGDANSGRVNPQSNHGLIHMKYGLNRHWEKSKKALHLIPKSLKEGKQVPGDTPYKYNIIYRDKKTHRVYIVGIPSEYGDETVLISCL